MEKYFEFGKDTKIEIISISITKPVELAVTCMKLYMDRFVHSFAACTYGQ